MILLTWLVMLAMTVEALLFGTVTAVSMIPYPTRSADCAIVLGARVWPDGKVSNALAYRLDAALEAYNAGRVKAVIVTGAQGGTEPISEAAAGKAYLVKHGMPASAVYEEDGSYDTIQDMQNAKAIMQANGMETALIATSDYHIARAMWIAKDAGLKAYALPAKSPVTPHTWVLNRVRETVSWVLYWARKIL